MEDYKKQTNETFFRMIIMSVNNGGVYIYPAAEESYTIVDGVMYGTKKGVKIIKKITPKSFHPYIKEQPEE